MRIETETELGEVGKCVWMTKNQFKLCLNLLIEKAKYQYQPVNYVILWLNFTRFSIEPQPRLYTLHTDTQIYGFTLLFVCVDDGNATYFTCRFVYKKTKKNLIRT